MATKKTGRRKVLFNFTAEPGSKVTIAGTFNDWDPKARKLKEVEPGNYQTAMLLDPGFHQYKFVVNDEHWHLDPHNDGYEFGGETMNSAIQVLPARPGSLA